MQALKDLIKFLTTVVIMLSTFMTSMIGTMWIAIWVSKVGVAASRGMGINPNVGQTAGMLTTLLAVLFSLFLTMLVTKWTITILYPKKV